jgi:stage III sporulation protein AF
MEFMKGWIINIVTTMIFVAFVEVLVPGSSMRKYVNLVIGLLVMIVIISPLLHLAAGDYNIGMDILNKGHAIDLRDTELLLNSVKQQQKESITRVYREKVQRQVSEQVMHINPGSNAVAEVFIDEDHDSKSFGKILGIRVLISPGKEGQDIEDGIEVSRIKVNIDGQSTENAVEALSREQDLTRLNIASHLSEMYRVPVEDIEVVLKGH